MAERFRFPRHGEPVDPAYIALLERIERHAILLDARYRIPGTRISFGLDPLIGIIPIAGDIVSAAWSIGLLTAARQLGAQPALLRKMALLVAVDFLIGLVPIAGPIADIFYRSNMRNLNLLLTAIAHARSPSAPQ